MSLILVNICLYFYLHEMQCMSAVFAVAKCLSVRPSVTTRYIVSKRLILA